MGVYYQTVMGDNEKGWQRFLRALNGSELIILTGGLGPTEDDITARLAKF